MSKEKKHRGNATDSGYPDVRETGKKRGPLRKTLLVIVLFLLLFAGATAVYKFDMLPQAASLVWDLLDRGKQEYSLYGDFRALCDEARALSAGEIRSREPVYVIDTEAYVSPLPDASLYDENFENYSDKTIEVHYRSERMHQSWFHFMEVRIKHPSQLRMALAYDKYGSYRRLPTQISSDVNAVCAVNGCFYNRRTFGVLIYRRNILRNRPFGVEVLLIDSDANFHIVKDRELMSSGVLDEYDIISGVSFGPTLVRDGEELRIRALNWEPLTNEPRTAICQYDDDLHYLVVLAEGRNTRSDGVTMQTFAHEVAAQGVKTAYNLDGGQSGTMVIGNHLKNRVGWGPEKAQSDILYFATGLGVEQKTETGESAE